MVDLTLNLTTGFRPIESNVNITVTFLCICYVSYRVGIIGEPMSGFNPLTLAPFGEEHEEETGDEDESGRRYRIENSFSLIAHDKEVARAFALV